MRDYRKSIGFLTCVSLPICAYVWYVNTHPHIQPSLDTRFKLKFETLLEEQYVRADDTMPRTDEDGNLIDYDCNLEHI